ncbi:hypothetical protein KEM55_003607, partial [Ascosphaera atra]
LVESKVLEEPLSLGDLDTLKVQLTTKKESAPEKPHQAFLLLRDAGANLDISYPFSVKESGKAVVEVKPRNLPAQFLQPGKELEANLVIASFGAADGYNKPAFKLTVDVPAQPPAPADPLAQGRLEEIRHVFKPDPQSPAAIICTTFVFLLLATLPSLGGLWVLLGANTQHFSKAFSTAPLAHAIFLASIVSVEGVLFMYYSSWNLFQTIPAALAAGAVAFVSGSRALSEVQGRRLAGLR